MTRSPQTEADARDLLPYSLADALAATARPPSVSERRQLAILQTEVALDAMRAGDLSAAMLFLADAAEHLRAADTLHQLCAPDSCQQREADERESGNAVE